MLWWGGGVILPVGAVVNPTHLLARLQQVKNPCGAATLFLNLQVATFDLRLRLSVYVQGLLVWGVNTLIRDKEDRQKENMRTHCVDSFELIKTRVLALNIYHQYKSMIDNLNYQSGCIFISIDLSPLNTKAPGLSLFPCPPLFIPELISVWWSRIHTYTPFYILSNFKEESLYSCT